MQTSFLLTIDIFFYTAKIKLLTLLFLQGWLRKVYPCEEGFRI